MPLEGGWREMRLEGESDDLVLFCSEGPGVISILLVDFIY